MAHPHSEPRYVGGPCEVRTNEGVATPIPLGVLPVNPSRHAMTLGGRPPSILQPMYRCPPPQHTTAVPQGQYPLHQSVHGGLPLHSMAGAAAELTSPPGLYAVLMGDSGSGPSSQNECSRRDSNGVLADALRAPADRISPPRHPSSPESESEMISPNGHRKTITSPDRVAVDAEGFGPLGLFGTLSPAGGSANGRMSNSRKILVRVRLMWLNCMPEGRPRTIACFILDKHGNQMPYDRQYWSYAYKANRLTDRDEQTRCNLDKGVDTLKRFVLQVERAGEVVRAFMTDAERSNHIPSDLTDEYLKQWLSGPNAMLIRKLINNDPEVRDVQLPTCLNADNLARALNHGGLLIKIPPHSQRSYDYFNLLSPGRGDTRHTELSIPDGGQDIDVKKSRTQLAFPPCYFPDCLPLPKVCVFQIDAKLELLLFYRGNNQKRPKRSGSVMSAYSEMHSAPTANPVAFLPSNFGGNTEDEPHFICLGAGGRSDDFDAALPVSPPQPGIPSHHPAGDADGSNLSGHAPLAVVSAMSPGVNPSAGRARTSAESAIGRRHPARDDQHRSARPYGAVIASPSVQELVYAAGTVCNLLGLDEPRKICPSKALKLSSEFHKSLLQDGEDVLLIQTADNRLLLLHTHGLVESVARASVVTGVQEAMYTPSMAGGGVPSDNARASHEELMSSQLAAQRTQFDESLAFHHRVPPDSFSGSRAGDNPIGSSQLRDSIVTCHEYENAMPPALCGLAQLASAGLPENDVGPPPPPRELFYSPDCTGSVSHSEHHQADRSGRQSQLVMGAQSQDPDRPVFSQNCLERTGIPEDDTVGLEGLHAPDGLHVADRGKDSRSGASCDTAGEAVGAKGPLSTHPIMGRLAAAYHMAQLGFDSAPLPGAPLPESFLTKTSSSSRRSLKGEVELTDGRQCGSGSADRICNVTTSSSFSQNGVRASNREVVDRRRLAAPDIGSQPATTQDPSPGQARRCEREAATSAQNVREPLASEVVVFSPYGSPSNPVTPVISDVSTSTTCSVDDMPFTVAAVDDPCGAGTVRCGAQSFRSCDLGPGRRSSQKKPSGELKRNTLYCDADTLLGTVGGGNGHMRTLRSDWPEPPPCKAAKPSKEW